MSPCRPGAAPTCPRPTPSARGRPIPYRIGDRLTEFFAATLFGVQGMHWRVDLHRRAKQCVVTDSHMADIQNHAIEIEEHTLAQLDVDAVVAEERRLHPHGVSTCAKQLTEDATPFLLLRLSGRIQRLAEITGALSPRDELGIERVVHLAGQHLLAFGHLGLVSHITSLSKDDDRSSNDALSDPSALAHGVNRTTAAHVAMSADSARPRIVNPYARAESRERIRCPAA